MSDHIRHLFELLDAEPSDAFVADLRARLMEDVMQPTATAVDQRTTEGVPTMTITENRPDGTQAKIPPGRRVGLIAASVAAAAALVVTGLVVANRDDEPRPPTTPSTPSTVASTTPATTTPTPSTNAPVIDSVPALPVPTAEAVPAPTALAAATTLADDTILQVKFDGFNLWTVGRDMTTLNRIDTTTGEVAETLTLPAPASPDWVETNNGYLYVLTEEGVVIVNGQTKAMTGLKASSDAGQAVSMGFTTDAAWIFRLASDGSSQLERWDLALTSLQLSVPLDLNVPAGMAGVGDQIYVGSEKRGLLHFDVDGNLVNEIADVGYTFDMMATPSGAALWVADYDSGEVIRIDPTTDEIVARVRLSGIAAHSVWATDTSVWATTWSATRVSVIDPATNTMTADILAGGSPMTLSFADGRIWVAGEGWLHSFQPA